MTPDLILLNANIHMMDPARPQARAMALAGGRIVALGDDLGDDLGDLVRPGMRVIDAGGRLVLPGFQDAHVHLLSGGVDLGVMANMQPLWAAWDPIIPDFTMAMVGAARLAQVYAFRSLIDAGAPFCISSDWPVTTLNPFEIIGTAVTREPPRHRGRAAVFGAGERISVGEAVLGYTRNAAAACWRGQQTGALAPGMSGDFILLDRNILTCDAYAIAETQALLTVLEGRDVFRHPAFSD